MFRNRIARPAALDSRTQRQMFRKDLERLFPFPASLSRTRNCQFAMEQVKSPRVAEMC